MACTSALGGRGQATTADMAGQLPLLTCLGDVSLHHMIQTGKNEGTLLPVNLLRIIASRCKEP